jgi:hypothetical protein
MRERYHRQGKRLCQTVPLAHERNHCSFSLKFMECPVKEFVHEWREMKDGIERKRILF